jgi:hypothetical protein
MGLPSDIIAAAPTLAYATFARVWTRLAIRRYGSQHPVIDSDAATA